MDFTGTKGMSPRKEMAQAGSPSFGVKSMGRSAGAHPDRTAGTGMKGAMADSERGVGAPVQHTRGMHPAQAAPDHGTMHAGYNAHDRGAKV